MLRPIDPEARSDRGADANRITLEELPLRDELRGEEPYGAPQLDVPVCLNTNENPFPPSERVVADIAEAVAEAARGLNRYPDREAWALRDDLASYLNEESGVDLGPAQVWAANGSNEIITQVLQAFAGPGRTVVSFAPTYSMYSEYARNTHSAFVTGHRRPDFGFDLDHARTLIADHQPSVVILTSPNNPTGTALSPADVRAVCEMAPGIVLVDEAYAEFRRRGVPSALELLPEFGRLVVTRTMSKAFALAGGRLGYLAAAPAVVDAVRIVRLPYHLSVVSQATARAAIRHSGELLSRVGQLRLERDDAVAWLRAQGLQAADSDANFVLFGRFADRHAVWSGLLAHGVLIREVGPDGWLRVSVGTPEEMSVFRRALNALLPSVRILPPPGSPVPDEIRKDGADKHAPRVEGLAGRES